MKRVAAGLACALLSAAPAFAQDLRPPHLTPATDSVEGGLWSQFDKVEAQVKTSGEREPDAAVGDYVRGVLCKLAAEYCDDLRIYVLDRPALNAAAAANGYVEVWTGTLLRVRTEDELAFVLGHEISHFARRHTLERWNKNKRTRDTMLVLTAAVGAVAVGASYSVVQSGSPYAGQTIQSISRTAQDVSNLIYLAGVASLFSFDREEESEADRLGLQRATAAGYSPAAGRAVWAAQIAETQASDFAPVRRSETRASIFDTHPLSAERIAALKALSPNEAPPTPEALHRYRAVIRPHLIPWLRDDMRRRDFGETIHLIDALAAEGEDLGVLAYMRGEAYRLRRHVDDPPFALREYANAAREPDAPPQTWRELGEALRKAGDPHSAAEAFRTYLAKAPAADDRWLIEDTLKRLDPATSSATPPSAKAAA